MKNKTYLSSGGAFINGKYLNKQDATILISIMSYPIDNYQMCNYTCQIQIHVSHKKKKKKNQIHVNWGYSPSCCYFKQKKKKKLGLPYVWMEKEEGKKEGGQYVLTFTSLTLNWQSK